MEVEPESESEPEADVHSMSKRKNYYEASVLGL